MDCYESSGSQNDLTELTLNHEGEDHIVVVPLNTANLLLNDPNAAKTFIVQSICESQGKQPAVVGVSAEASCSYDEAYQDEATVEPQQAHTSSTDSVRNECVWKSKKPSKRDLEATEYFLKLRHLYGDRFDDRKTIKSQIWQSIGKKMNQEGFYVGEGRDAVEKCRIKFANMQKQYLQHIKHVNTTGEGTKSEPPFFSELHDILGKKVNPKNLQDRLDDSINPSCDEEEKESTSSSGVNEFVIKNGNDGGRESVD